MAMQMSYEAVIYDLLGSLSSSVHSALSKENGVDFFASNRGEYKKAMHILRQIYRLKKMEGQHQLLKQRSVSDSCQDLDRMLTSVLPKARVQMSPARSSSRESNFQSQQDPESVERKYSQPPKLINNRDLDEIHEEPVSACVSPPQGLLETAPYKDV